MYYPANPEERFEIENALDFYTTSFRPNMTAALGVYVGNAGSGNPLNKHQIK